MSTAVRKPTWKKDAIVAIIAVAVAFFIFVGSFVYFGVMFYFDFTRSKEEIIARHVDARPAIEAILWYHTHTDNWPTETDFAAFHGPLPPEWEYSYMPGHDLPTIRTHGAHHMNMWYHCEQTQSGTYSDRWILSVEGNSPRSRPTRRTSRDILRTCHQMTIWLRSRLR